MTPITRACRRLVTAALLVLSIGPAPAEARSWAWLGVRIRDLSEFEMEDISRRHGIREGYGVVIVGVVEESPAERAGIQGGDIVAAQPELTGRRHVEAPQHVHQGRLAGS